MYKQTNIKKSVKKSGSLESASDRSVSPNDIMGANENKSSTVKNRQQIIPKKTKSDNVKTGITKPKPTTKSSTKSAIKTSPVKQTKASSNANSKLPRVKTGSATPPTRANTKNLNSAKSPPNLKAAKSPRSSNDPKAVNPNWKVPCVSPPLGKASPVKPLPGRGGPKKLKKVFNPPTLFSMCKAAVSSIVISPQVDEEAKEFLKRRLFSQALFGTVWEVLTKETKSNRVTKGEYHFSNFQLETEI
ncbi:uncharacterized protein LOC134825763 [Bolinopsis microptera]|uniref:uncharacterized protein LOC134825763 n=1 Tax=Bolinopsis microptera TaxID=2820187 RepID=UPI003079A384